LKRIIAISLLGIFTFNLMGFFLLFKIQQFRISQETTYYIKRDVPKDKLALITITSENRSDLDWKHEREFRYKGVVYDIVKKEMIDAHTAVYHCLTDELVTTLFLDLDELVKKNMEAKNKGNDLIKNLYELFLSGIYALPQKLIWTLFPTDSSVSYLYLTDYSSPVFDITGPPPKLS
jgi:hypothetical protein